jgi:hypothetical protein
VRACRARGSNQSVRIRSVAVVATALLASAACATNPDGTSAPSGPKVELMPLPTTHIDECRRFPRLQPVCPTSIPVVKASRKRAQAFKSGPNHFVFFSEWSGPYPGVTAKNAPPRFVHVVVHARVFDKAFSLQWPTETTALPDRIPKRREPILLDNVTWYGKSGWLVLAPSFPTGGIDGDHVVFQWAEGGVQYAISIHGWSPLNASIEALEADLGSTALAQRP